MKSLFFLTFKNPQDLKKYNQLRTNEINKITFLLLVQRAIFAIVLLINHLEDSERIPLKRVYLKFIGVGIHLLLAVSLLIWKNSIILQYGHSPLVILSHIIFAFINLSKTDQIIAFYAQLLVVFACAILLNQCWILTSLAMMFGIVGVLINLGMDAGLPLKVIIPEMVLLYCVLTCYTYFVERKFKEEYLQIRMNKTLKKEFRHMLDVVPEGIMIYDPLSKGIVMTNTELQRLVYNESGLQPLPQIPSSSEIPRDLNLQNGQTPLKFQAFRPAESPNSSRSFFNFNIKKSRGSTAETASLPLTAKNLKRLDKASPPIDIKIELANRQEDQANIDDVAIEILNNGPIAEEKQNIDNNEMESSIYEDEGIFSKKILQQYQDVTESVQALRVIPYNHEINHEGRTIYDTIEDQNEVPMTIYEALEKYSDEQYYEILFPQYNAHPPRLSVSNFLHGNDDHRQSIQITKESQIVQFKRIQLHYQNKLVYLLVIKNLTQMVRYKQMQIENQFSELLTATVSHEMRTPLNSMLVLLQKIGKYITDSQGQEILKVINSASSMLQYLVNDFLDLHQIKKGEFKKNELPFKVKQEIQMTMEIMRVPCMMKNIDLRLSIPPNFPEFLILDIQRLRQVLINLLQNALKFTYKGSITATIDYEPTTKYIVGSVEDTGIGISEVDQEKLFKIFGKLKSTQQLNTNGIGLGLFICKRLCEYLGGSINLESSKVNIGTKFAFRMRTQGIHHASSIVYHHLANSSPNNSIHHLRKHSNHYMLRLNSNNLNRQNTSSCNLMDGTDTPTQTFLQVPELLIQRKYQPSTFGKALKLLSRNIRILIVDDNVFNIKAVEAVIEDLFSEHLNIKLTIDTALNGQQAVEVMELNLGKRSSVDLIFMDCNMPIMDGIQATRAIREMCANGQQPYIVALTAYDTETFEEKCLQAGMNQFLTKPLQVDRVVGILRELGFLN